jgi:hypothetical protein
MTTRQLAVYAAILSTITAAWSIVWTIYSGLLRDRPRIKLIAARDAEHPDAVTVLIFNRGRRAIHLLILSRVSSAVAGTTEVAMLPDRMVKGATIDADRSRSWRIDEMEGYEPSDLPLKRWYIVDEAKRTYPLRERHRQRVERVVFWPTRKLYDRRAARG